MKKKMVYTRKSFLFPFFVFAYNFRKSCVNTFDKGDNFSLFKFMDIIMFWAKMMEIFLSVVDLHRLYIELIYFSTSLIPRYVLRFNKEDSKVHVHTILKLVSTNERRTKKIDCVM